MSDLIRREDVIEALYEAIRTELKGTFTDSMSLAIAMANNLPSAEPEIITLEEVSYQLGCATIQSAFYWFEFLKTLDLLGFAIIRKETK